MFNALLNYAYGMLYNLVERSLIQAGVDPYVGIWHRDEYNRPVLAFDVIERFRAWAEYPVIDLCLQEVIFPEFFSIEGDGAYWLEDTGKRFLVTHVNDYLAELVVMKGKSRSRQEHIRLYGQELAMTFKNFNKS
jgi:CRISPR-associated protein Cas1